MRGHRVGHELESTRPIRVEKKYADRNGSTSHDNIDSYVNHFSISGSPRTLSHASTPFSYMASIGSKWLLANGSRNQVVRMENGHLGFNFRCLIYIQKDEGGGSTALELGSTSSSRAWTFRNF